MRRFAWLFVFVCSSAFSQVSNPFITFGTTLPAVGREGQTFVGAGNSVFPSGVSAYYHNGAWWLPSDLTSSVLTTYPATAEIFIGDIQGAGFTVTGKGTLANLTIDLRNISKASFNLAINTDTALASVSFPNLRDISGAGSDVALADSSSTVTSISFPSMANVSGAASNVNLQSALATSFSFPSLANISGNGAFVEIQNSPLLTSFTLPALVSLTGTGVVISGHANALPVANVNALLAQMASIGASGDTITLDAQSPAAPPTGPVGSSHLAIDTGTTTGSAYPDSFTWALSAVCTGTQASGTGTAVAGVPATVTLVVAGVGCPASTNAPTTTGAAGTGLALAFNTANMDTLLGRSWTVTTDVKAW